MSRDDGVDGLKVAELKEELKKQGLPVGGNKAELASRLKDALAGGSGPRGGGADDGQEAHASAGEPQPAGAGPAAAATPSASPAAGLAPGEPKSSAKRGREEAEQQGEQADGPDSKRARMGEATPAEAAAPASTPASGAEPVPAAQPAAAEPSAAGSAAAGPSHQPPPPPPPFSGSGRQGAGATADGDDDEDDERIVLPRGQRTVAVKTGRECPYLDTVSRQLLDFDFEKCCSVSLSPVNVYACLVCGKYFQGRGLHTHAYTHALETAHHMYMKLEDGKVYCLPDNYEVQDRSLDDVRHVLNPVFGPKEVAALDRDVTWARALDGTEYMPGMVGLNNMKRNDYANVVVQALGRIPPLRDFFLQPANYAACRSPLVHRFGELLRKMWNSRNFKGQVSPHEFMQAVIAASKKRFTIDGSGADPLDFWSWLLNTLHMELTGGSPKKSSIITTCFQGELEVTTEAGTGKGKAAGNSADVVERMPFLLLGLDLPPAPLFKDAMEKNIIPQVPIFQLLSKFDGIHVHDDIRAGRRRFRLLRLPTFLALHMKRFTKNNFFQEKNPTIVNFPVKNLKLQDAMPLPGGPEAATSTRYDLVANIVHQGKAGEGAYLLHLHRKVEDKWYEVQDLRVSDILPQMVALSEAYFQVYELKQ